MFGTLRKPARHARSMIQPPPPSIMWVSRPSSERTGQYLPPESSPHLGIDVDDIRGVLLRAALLTSTSSRPPKATGFPDHASGVVEASDVSGHARAVP